MKVDYFRLFIGHSGVTDTVLAAKSRSADVLFVDVETVGYQTVTTAAAGVRRLATEIEAHGATVVRAPEHFEATDPATSRALAEEFRTEIYRRLRTTELDTNIAVLAHHGLDQPSLYGAETLTRFFGGPMIPELRSAEINALISHRGAMIESNELQFVLPNDTTTSSFLRVGDIIASRRDCTVLSSWVLPLLPRAPKTFAIGIDTPALLPLTLQLELDLRLHGRSIDQVVVAPGYPFGVGDVDELFPHLGPTDGFLYLLSVSRSGRFEAVVRSALATMNRAVESRLVVLAQMLERVPGSVGFDGHTAAALAQVDAPPPETEADTQGRPVVRVEPVTFRFSPQIGIGSIPIPPAPSGPERTFLDVCAQHRAVGVECAPHSTAGSARPRNRLIPFRVLLEPFSAGFVDEVSENAELRSLVAASIREAGIRSAYDMVVVPDADAFRSGEALPRIERFLGLCGLEVGEITQLRDLPSERTTGAPRVALFMWGAVTGASMIRSVREVRSRVPDAHVDALVVHLRPPSEYEESYIRRELGEGSFAAVWTSLVPWTSSFAPEASRLSRWVGEEPHGSERWAERLRLRLETIAPAGPNRDWEFRANESEGLGPVARKLLWVEPTVSRLTDSWLSDQPTALLAAAIALETERRRSGSEALRLDMRTIASSGTDLAWLACIVRVARIGELWFGASASDQVERAAYVCDWMAENDAEHVLLAELLAAEAGGKLPTAAANTFRKYAEGSRDDEVIELLYEFARWARGS